MNARVATCAALSLSLSRAAFADPAPLGAELEARAHFGVATTPFGVAALPEAKGQAFTFLLAGRYAISAPLSLTLRLPLAIGSVAQPAGSYIDTAALGAPQLGARYRLLEHRSDPSAPSLPSELSESSMPSTLALAVALEVGAPLASHGENLLQNRLLAIADGIEGRGNPEWFTPGVVPITPSAALDWETGRLRLTTELRLPMLVRISDADLPPSSAEPRAFGLAATAGVEARYRLSRRLSVVPAAHLAFDLVPAVAHVRDVSPVQDFERVSLHIHFGSSATLTVDVQTAIAGELGGSMVAGGLRAGVDLR